MSIWMPFPNALICHECNAFCDGGLHCHLLHAATFDPADIMFTLAYDMPWALDVRVEPAREAPPIDPGAKVYNNVLRDHLPYRDVDATPHGFLVYFRLPDGLAEATAAHVARIDAAAESTAEVPV